MLKLLKLLKWRLCENASATHRAISARGLRGGRLQRSHWRIWNEGIDVDAAELYGEAIPIMTAIRHDNLEVYRLLADRGASLKKEKFHDALSFTFVAKINSPT